MNLSLTEFDSVPYERSNKGRGSEVLIFIKNNLSYKIGKDLSKSDEDKEILFLEILNENSSKIPPTYCLKQPKVDNAILSMLLKKFLKSLLRKRNLTILSEVST